MQNLSDSEQDKRDFLDFPLLLYYNFECCKRRNATASGEDFHVKEKVLRRNTNIDVIKCPAAFLVIGTHFSGCAVDFFRLGHWRSLHDAAV